MHRLPFSSSSSSSSSNCSSDDCSTCNNEVACNKRDGHLGISFNCWIISSFCLLVGARRRFLGFSICSGRKEKEFGENKILSDFPLFRGHPRFEAVSDGLLLMSKSLWFENFGKGPNIFGITPP